MRSARLIPVLAVLALLAAAHASSAAVQRPDGLRGFLLRADEPPTQSFNRTPSFAWNPVPGAARYQFQLATSSTFRDNGVLYDDSTLLTPVAAPPLTLPWITGSPFALYARVRALFTSGAASPWSAAFGFDMTPPPPPTPLSTYPGMLRWTPVEGATAYQVWLLDAGKMETVRTTVLDEREYYTFHQAAAWTASVHWRIRAVRDDMLAYRINGLPATHYGAWSPTYTSTNAPLANAPLTLVGTVAQSFSDGSPTSPAHGSMPAFVWSGDEGLSGQPADLYRVYVFTDRQCLNRVYTSAVVGSPAYAPRLGGPLSLPASSTAVALAKASYLGDGQESSDLTYDDETITPNEQLAPAQPTVTVPGNVPAAPGTVAPTAPSSGSSDSSGAGASGSSSSTTGAVGATGNVGPPIDLWDVNWPQGGYYWTVIPVLAAGAGGTTVALPGAAKGSTTVPVSSTIGFATGDSVTIGVVPNIDSGKVVAIGADSITLDQPLAHDHPAGDSIERAIRYVDLELPQDACAAGRVQRLGISSQAALTTAQAPFATGLSSRGRLISAAEARTFYGQPLVAWTPALSASLYEVQWSKTRYPFVAQPDPRSKTNGFLTYSTSAVLPLGAGTWWYRVRGFDYNLPTGVQQMSWSDPQKLVVTAPKFTVTKTAAKKKRFKVVGGKP